MFLTKQKKIEHLQEIIALKDAEIKTMKDERQAERKRLFAALNENLKLKRRVKQLEGVCRDQSEEIQIQEINLQNTGCDWKRLKELLRDRESEVWKLEGRLEDAEQVQLALERDARQKRQRIYAACAKMRRQIKTQQQTIEVLQHNIHAIMATYEQCDDRNRQLEGLTREQSGRLAVYEKLVGEIPRHEVVSE